MSKHGDLAAVLRDLIDDGTYGPKDEFPSEAELMKRHRLSRTTVRTALTTLRNEGLLSSSSGVGYRVPARTYLQYRPQHDFRRPSTVPESKVITGAEIDEDVDLRSTFRVGTVEAAADVARRLDVEAGEDVWERWRKTSVVEEKPHDDEESGSPQVTARDNEQTAGRPKPYRLNISYYPPDVVAGTTAMAPRDEPRGINQVLADNGYPQVRALDEIWVRMPTPEEARELEIASGVPVAEHRVTGFDAHGRVVRTVKTILPGDRSVITFDRSHPDHG